MRKEKYNPATTTTTPMYVTLRLPPLDSETGWTGDTGQRLISSRETVPSQTSDMGKKTLSVLAHSFLLP